MISFERRTYRIPEPTEIWFFDRERAFLRHVQDHFLNPDEFWGHLLGGERFLRELERTLGSEFLLQAGQKWNPEEVSMLREIYRQVFPILDDGMAFSSELPLYVWFRRKVQDVGGTETKIEEGFHFLSRWGFVVVVKERVVRSAYFQRTRLGGAEKGDYANVFREAWEGIRDKFNRKRYFDSKYQRHVEYVEKKMVSPGNWILPPDPRPDPRSAVGRPQRERSGRRNWLDGLDEVLARRKGGEYDG